MAEDQNSIDNVEIEPLSDEDLESVAGGAESTPSTSTGPSCCSCSGCSSKTGFAEPGFDATI